MTDQLMTAERVLDGVMNFMTLMGTRVDPNEGNMLVPDCERDRLTWYKNGGLADKIVNFWGDSIGTELQISIAAKDNARGRKESSKLQEWLQSEYKRLDVLGTFKMAQLQCNIDRAAPILIVTDGLSAQSQGFSSVVGLKICNPTFMLPCEWLPIVDDTEPIDHRFVTKYQLMRNNLGTGSIFYADRVLAMQGRKLLPSETFSLASDWLDLRWGMPLIANHTIEAALKYDLAISLSMVLLHKKNTIVQKFSKLFEAAASPNAKELIGNFMEIAMRLQTANGVNNVLLADMELSDIDVVDRNLSGVPELVDKAKDYVLANCPNIPQSHLFGRHERTGGLSASNDESEDVNAHAQMMYQERWEPLLDKLNRVLVMSDSCPVKNVDPSKIKVLRKSGFTPDPTEEAKLRLTYTEMDKILLDSGAITEDEMRGRHIDSEFNKELLLESPKAPGKPEIEAQPATGKIPIPKKKPKSKVEL